MLLPDAGLTEAASDPSADLTLGHAVVNDTFYNRRHLIMIFASNGVIDRISMLNGYSAIVIDEVADRSSCADMARCFLAIALSGRGAVYRHT